MMLCIYYFESYFFFFFLLIIEFWTFLEKRVLFFFNITFNGWAMFYGLRLPLFTHQPIEVLGECLSFAAVVRYKSATKIFAYTFWPAFLSIF